MSATISHIPQQILVHIEVFRINIWRRLAIIAVYIFNWQPIQRRFRLNSQISLINWRNIPLVLFLLFSTSKIVLDARKDLRNAIFIRFNHFFKEIWALSTIWNSQGLDYWLILRILVQITHIKAQTVTLVTFYALWNQKRLILSCIYHHFFAKVKTLLVLNSLPNFIKNASSVKFKIFGDIISGEFWDNICLTGRNIGQIWISAFQPLRPVFSQIIRCITIYERSLRIDLLFRHDILVCCPAPFRVWIFELPSTVILFASRVMFALLAAFQWQLLQ